MWTCSQATSRQEEGSEAGRAAEIVSELDGKAQQLRAALGGTGVDHPETALREPAKVPKEVLAALEALVDGINTLFLQLQRLEGVHFNPLLVLPVASSLSCLNEECEKLFPHCPKFEQRR